MAIYFIQAKNIFYYYCNKKLSDSALAPARHFQSFPKLATCDVRRLRQRWSLWESCRCCPPCRSTSPRPGCSSALMWALRTSCRAGGWSLTIGHEGVLGNAVDKDGEDQHGHPNLLKAHLVMLQPGNIQKADDGLDSAAVSIFVVIYWVFVNSTNKTTNIETAVLSNQISLDLRPIIVHLCNSLTVSS